MISAFPHGPEATPPAVSLESAGSRFSWECEVAHAISHLALDCARDLRSLNNPVADEDALDLALAAHDSIRQAQRRIRALLVHLSMFTEEGAWSSE